MNNTLKKDLDLYTGAIFDVDGVLLNSMIIWDKAASTYLKQNHRTPKADLNAKLSTLSLLQGATYLQEEYQLPYTVDEINDGITHVIEDFYVYEVELKRQVLPLLKMLEEHNIPMIVASSGDETCIRKAFERLQIDSYFIDICTCNKLQTSKTKPDIYLHCAKQMHSDISKTLVFEDALHAIQTANDANFTVVGVYDSYNQKDENQIKQLSRYYIQLD